MIKRKLFLVILGVVPLAAAIWYLSPLLGKLAGLESTPELIALKDLPEVGSDVIAAQGKLFSIEEPFLYNRKTKVAEFVAEILSTRNFGEETHLYFDGDDKSLQRFANEIRLVNSGPSRIKGAAQGMEEGIESLVSGLWQLLRHPFASVKGLGSAAIELAKYLKDSPWSQIKEDTVNLANAYYVNSACEVAEQHSVDYFELKTDRGKAVICGETNLRLGGQGLVELATLLIPLSKLKYAAEAEKAGEAVIAATKAAEAANLGEKMAEAGKLSIEAAKFGRAWKLFPRRAETIAATFKRLEHAVPPKRFTPPIAKLGEAVSVDYKATFFAKHPQLQGEVVVHHAVEQQALTRYPGLFTDAEIHSLENLRGIPKNLDSTLHQSYIKIEWNEFYRSNPAGSVTRQKLLDKASEIDRKFGHQFKPALL